MTTISMAQFLKDRQMDKPILVAVYGTLKKGFRNHSWLAGAKYVGTGVTKNKYLMTHNLGHFTMDKAYPYVCINPVDKTYATTIVVEVYELYSLASLDHLEQFPKMFKRDLVDVNVLVGIKEPVQAWLYHTQNYQHMPVIETGNWSKKEHFVGQATSLPKAKPISTIDYSSEPFIPFANRKHRSSFEEIK